MTKEERAEYQKRYVAEHREEINANARYRYKKNPEVMDKQHKRMKAYYEKHKNDPEYKAKQKERYKRWHEKNREQINAKKREYYWENHDLVRAYQNGRNRARKGVANACAEEL